MKFVCDSCHAQYMISDDKVGANGVKVRCKKCSNIIVVKKAQEQAEATMVMQNPLVNAQQTGPDALFGGVGMDEIGQAFDNVLSNSGPQKRLDAGADSDEPTVGASTALTQTEMPMAASGTSSDLGDHESTRVMDLKSMAGLAAQSSEPTGLSDIPDAIKAQGFVDGNKAKNEVNGHANGSNGTNGTNGAAVPQTDWYVAIDEEQKGPMTLDQVKGHWEQGKVTPDSLVWRNGYSDWKPLSTIPELVKVLTPIPAPRKAPEKKPDEAPAGATASGPQLPASVTPAPMAVPDPDEVDWKPSAASALASLVADEMEALSKPAPKPRTEPVGVGETTNALLPKPILSVEPPHAPQPETPITMNRLISAANAEVGASPVSPRLPENDQPEVIVRPPPPAAAAPSPYAAAYPPAPEVPSYPAPAAYVPPVAGSNNTKYIVIGVAVVLVCLTAVAITYLLSSRPSPTQNQVAMNEPRPQPKAVEAQPVAAPQPKAAPVQAQPAQPAAQPVQTQPAQPAAQPQPAPKVEEPPAEPPRAVANETPSQKKDRYEKWKQAHEAAMAAKAAAAEQKKQEREAAKEAKAAAAANARAEKAAGSASSDDLLSAGSGSKVDKDFDQLLGGGGGSTDDTPKPQKKKAEVYIPGDINSSLPPQLGQGDIMGVVAGHKSQIVGCINQQRAKDPDSSGTVKMHWVIQKNGGVSGVSVGTDEFRSSPMGKCMSGIIRSWKFPQFSGPPMPIDFPFKF